MTSTSNGRKSNEQTLQTTADVLKFLKSSVLKIDPVQFCEDNLTLDGKPFRLRKNGYKPFIDIYRYIGIKALERNRKSKPIVLVKGRQVGATTMGANLEMYWMGSGLFGTNGRPPMRIMHCFPILTLANAYTKTKLNPTISQSDQVVDSKGRTKGIMETLINPNVSDSLMFKEFINGNHIWIESLGVDADRVRGRTVDCLIVDEVQDTFKRAILNATKILAKSQYGRKGQGVQVYMGTPKSKDSVYYEMWMDSSQHNYFLHCEHCDQLFPFFVPGTNSWEQVWLDGFTEQCDCGCGKVFTDVNHETAEEFYGGYQVRCTHCGHIQDKRESAENGKWVGRENADDYKFLGFHINQLYMPEYTKEDIVSQKPENNPLSDETSWRNEVLGEFYSGEGLTITADEIKAKCSDYDRAFTKRIMPEEVSSGENGVYMGVDWGKKIDASQLGIGENKAKTAMGKSYSVAVILKVEGPQLFSVEYAVRMTSNEYEYKLELLDELIRRYSIKQAVGDIGYGNDIMGTLYNKYGNQFLASEANGAKVTGRIKFCDDDFPKVIRFERDYYISEMFKLLRKGAIRLPMKSWEQLSWLIHHCASMVAKPEVDRYGNVKVRYAKGNIPNDGLMALLNAYIAYKYDVTNGFQIKEKLYSDEGVGLKGVKKPTLVALAHIPRLKS